jgi:hypothetical protein
MGGVLHVAPGAPRAVQLEVRVQRASGQKAEIVRNGEIVATLDVSSDDATLSQALELTAGQWVHVRLRDAKGITAFANPIYARATAPSTAAAGR